MFHVKQLHALLINPFFYDFSAYSFWSTPLGLLYMGAILRENGILLSLIDCVRVVENKRKKDARAPFLKERVETPQILQGIEKRLKRYGISREVLREELLAQEKPDMVLITSILTYWYQGTKEVIDIVRDVFPDVKIIVGGIYPTLCNDHASRALAGADMIVKNSEIDKFYRYVETTFSYEIPFKPMPDDMERIPYPCFDLYPEIPFMPLLTSCGCAFRCAYCATPYMYPRIVRRRPGHVIDEIRFWCEKGVRKYVFYDDSLLYRGRDFAKPLLKEIGASMSGLKFYNPNAVNAAFIDEELAELFVSSGFQEIRIGLETIDRTLQKKTSGKVSTEMFERALGALNKAGFPMEFVHVYILAGLPRQRWQTVKEAIDYLAQFRVEINLAEYTPIPHTPMYDEYKEDARYPIASDPLFQNNALFPFAWKGFTDDDMAYVKNCAREHNRVLPNNPCLTSRDTATGQGRFPVMPDGISATTDNVR